MLSMIFWLTVVQFTSPLSPFKQIIDDNLYYPRKTNKRDIYNVHWFITYFKN